MFGTIESSAGVGMGVSTESVEGVSVVVLECAALPEGLVDFNAVSARELARRLVSAADAAERADAAHLIGG